MGRFARSCSENPESQSSSPRKGSTENAVSVVGLRKQLASLNEILHLIQELKEKVDVTGVSQGSRSSCLQSRRSIEYRLGNPLVLSQEILNKVIKRAES